MKAVGWMIGLGVLVLAAGGVLLLTNGRTAESPPAQSTPSVEGGVPAFSLSDYGGKTVTLNDFAGRPLVINSWAAWCPFCVEELDDFAAVQKEFGDRVTIIAVDRAESLSVAKEFTDELGVTDDLVFLLDPTDSLYTSIGGFSMPETIFVDAQRNIQFHKRGPMDRDEIRQRVETLIE